MPAVEVQLPADEIVPRITEMRAWFARHRAPEPNITYTKTASHAVVRVNLAASEAETFAKRFGGRLVEE